jgi:hypothetical protein
MAKGTPIMVALPLQFAKSDVSTSPRKGWKKKAFKVAAVGKADCSNPLRDKVWVYLWVRPQKPKPKVKKVIPTIRKIAEDAAGHQLPAVPTNIFKFRVTCDGHSQTVTYNESPQSVGMSCTVGHKVTFVELPTSGWELLGPAKQVFKVKSGVQAVYKNRQRPSSTPTAPVTLIKYAIVDGNTITTPSGFGFTANGTAFSNTGQSTNVGLFQVGTSVTICETNPMGYTPDKSCETKTVGSSGTTFTFTNRKVTPPPPHWTQVTCTGFEEISGSGSFLVDCDVSNDNGAPISLSVNSNDTNSRVSGINCITNGGSASCPGNGTFEFRVSGINDGTTVLYSTVTAVASSNGITATYNSGQFPVDPSGGGF